MLISDSHKFVFHHVPKTGGSSITAALAQYCRNYEGEVPSDDTPKWQLAFHQPNFMHEAISELTDIPEDYFSFAFVRNPFDAVASAWVPKKFKYFDEWIEQEVCTGNEWVSRWTQFGYLTNDKEKILVDFIGRFENFASDFYEVVKRIDAPLMMLPKRNITKDKSHEGYREYYSPDSRAMVEELFKKDLEFFEYEF